MSIPSTTLQKDYRPLSNHHAHINRLKNNNNTLNSNSLLRPLTTIIDGGGGSITTSATSTTTSPNVAMFLNNNHHHHHHQHHIHQHNNNNSNNNSNNNNNNNNNNNSNNCLSNMRKSYTQSDPSNASFSSASVAGSIQDDMSDQCSLTQAGLEEYNSRSFYDQPVFHHQKQSSYAQSEGYHSYVSSSDSSSATPFLDRLRQESELLSRQSHWSQNDLSPTSQLNNSGNTTNPTSDNNSSESTSSTETLKWLGSMSDVSVASHATNSSAISGSVSSSSQLIVHSSRVRTPKRHNSESVLYMNDDQMSVTNETITSTTSMITTTSINNNNNNNNNINNGIACNKTQAIYQHQHYHHQSNSIKSGDLHENSTISSGNTTGVPSSPLSTSPSLATLATSSSASMLTSSTTSLSSSSSSYRNNHRLFPVSTYTEPVNGSSLQTANNIDYQQAQQQQQHQQQYQQSAQPQQQNSQQIPGIKLSSPQSHNWQSVADRISDFERQQQHLSGHHHHGMQQQSHAVQKYTYIDPSKTHRVPNPTLKAFQKNAVQSYFERQQHNAKENTKNYSSPNNINRPQSLQLANSPKEVPLSHIRNSLPNNYGGQSNVVNKNSSVQQQIMNGNLIMPQINDDSPYSDCGIPPPPPPRSRSLMPIRRSSSASEYADFREHFIHAKEMIMKEPHIVSAVTSPEKLSFNDCGVPPPPPPPRGRISMPVRRTSSASEYAAVRDKNIQTRQNLSKDLLGPMIMGPIISVDDWVPERPPKNPHLRIPSPELPPPPPLQVIDMDVNILNQDEPLPPPPPEILRHMRQNSDNEAKPPSPNRRNSFAGSPSRKSLYRASTFENLSPPSVPKKPSTIDMMQTRPASSLAQSHKAHKVILNGKLESPGSMNSMSGSYPSSEQMPRATDARISVRKRTHNTPVATIEATKSPGKMNPHIMKSPPPLKPRMPIAGQEMRASSVAISSKLRCNSKASYLPRQSRDKPNITDPDHGIYKLTLTSNEDSINHNTSTSATTQNTTSSSYHDDILLTTKCNNLPDVLPVGVKTMQQPSSPSSSGSSPRYGSNNNINNLMNSSPHTAPIIPTSYPMKSMFHFQSPSHHQQHHPSNAIINNHNYNSNNNNIMNNHNHNRHNGLSPTSSSPPSYSMTALNRSSTSPLNTSISSNDSISPKFMSQSTIDLKKTHILEANETTSLTLMSAGKYLTPAQSESNIINNNHGNYHENQSLSQFSAKREYQKTEVVRKLSLEEHDPGEGRIVRAELVNTTLSTSPSKSDERMIIRKDSLRENIEKITQLQSKLMSAHLVENGTDRKLLGYSTKTVEIKSAKDYNKCEPKSPPITMLSTSIATLTTSSPIIQQQPIKLNDMNSNSLSTIPSSSEIERITKMDSEIDGLKLMQRTEIILRLNAPTMEAASQTDDTIEINDLSRVKSIDIKDDLNKSDDRNQSLVNGLNGFIGNETKLIILQPRKKLQEEIDCDNLSKDLVSHLTTSDKLRTILSPKIYKTTTDYVCNLYKTNIASRSMKKDVGTSTPNDKSIGCEIINNNNNINNNKNNNNNINNNNKNPKTITTQTSTVEVLTNDSNYFSTTPSSPPPSKMITRFSNREVTLINGDQCDVTDKKEELIKRLGKKLKVLSKVQTTIAEESSINDQLGNDIAIKVTEKVRPIDATKFRAYIDDVGHITMLLLSLSGRLAKAENALHSMITENHGDKKILEVKRDRLLEQLDEAKRLKEDIDRRGMIVGKILEKHLTNDEYTDYDYFINMKAKLIVDMREIADKIKLSEEQLNALKDTLVQSEC